MSATDDASPVAMLPPLLLRKPLSGLVTGDADEFGSTKPNATAEEEEAIAVAVEAASPALAPDALAASARGAMSGDRLAASLRAELGAAAAAADASPRLQKPLWLSDARAMTVFQDVDLEEMAARQADSWRKGGWRMKKKSLPPILLHKTATGMVILNEGRDAAQAVVKAMSEEELKAAAIAAAREMHKSTNPDPPKETQILLKDFAQGLPHLRGKRVVRFEYLFQPAPWKKGKREINKKAAKAAGVHADLRRLPLAPAHKRYIEHLEDDVSKHATECEFRKAMLMAKINYYMQPGWKPAGHRGPKAPGMSVEEAIAGGLVSAEGDDGDDEDADSEHSEAAPETEPALNESDLAAIDAALYTSGY